MSLLPRRLAPIAVVVITALFAVACGSDTGGSVASVGDRALSESDFKALLATTGEDPDAPVVAADLARSVIREWVVVESWIAELAERGTPLTEGHLAAARAALEAGAIGTTEPIDPDSAAGRIFTRYLAVEDLLADHLIETEEIRVLCSSHILLETEEEAVAAIARLDAGEDFAALAVELSTGPSGPTGGDLGCVDPRSFVPEFVAGAEPVDAPGISAPTQSDFGWHVISVRSFDTPSREDHPELSPAEVTGIVLQGSAEAIEEIAADLTDRDVEIDSRYGAWDPGTGQVVPSASTG